MPASPESVDPLVAAPAIAFLVVMGAVALEKVAIVTLNASDNVWHRLRYGPATDPETWPTWESIGEERPIDPMFERLKEQARRDIADGYDPLAIHRGMVEHWPELGEPPR